MSTRNQGWKIRQKGRQLYNDERLLGVSEGVGEAITHSFN